MRGIRFHGVVLHMIADHVPKCSYRQDSRGLEGWSREIVVEDVAEKDVIVTFEAMFGKWRWTSGDSFASQGPPLLSKESI